MGFCRTNLFKRLESSGSAFLQSVERHVLRNYVFLHALKNGLPLPLGTQDAEMLDSRFTDKDADEAKGALSTPTTTSRRRSSKRLAALGLPLTSRRGRPRYTPSTRAVTGAVSSGFALTYSRASLRASFSQTPMPSKPF